jgi:DNA invertase Pin-like site-specific DNA recombinase
MVIRNVLATHEVAQPSEHQRAEWPHRKARGERSQRKDETGDPIDAGEKLRAEMTLASRPYK